MGMTCQVNWGHVAVVVEDDGEGHLLCHLGQPGGGNVQDVVVVGCFVLLVGKPRVALDLVEDVSLEAFSHLVDVAHLVLVLS